MGRAHSKHDNMRYAYKITIGKYGKKGPYERPRYRWENNTKMNLGKRKCEGVN
jgi:hypothetical protein